MTRRDDCIQVDCNPRWLNEFLLDKFFSRWDDEEKWKVLDMDYCSWDDFGQDASKQNDFSQVESRQNDCRWDEYTLWRQIRLF